MKVLDKTEEDTGKYPKELTIIISYDPHEAADTISYNLYEASR